MRKRGFLALGAGVAVAALVYGLGSGSWETLPHPSVAPPQPSRAEEETAPRRTRRPTSNEVLRLARPADDSTPMEDSETETGRRERPQRDLTRALQPRPAWRGPWPASLAEVPGTDAIRARIEEYGGPSSVDQMLRFLDGMKRCMAAHPLEKAGGVAMELVYTIDRAQGTIQGLDAVLDQSTIAEGDDLRLLECARQLHVGQARKVSAEALEALGEAPDFVWRTTLALPIENDKFYPWLLSDPTPSL
jgi:hypothetical protein